MTELMAQNPHLSRSIESLILPKRIEKLLITSGITHVIDLVRTTEYTLLSTLFGEASVAKIKDALTKINLHLGMDIKLPPLWNKAIPPLSPEQVEMLKRPINYLALSPSTKIALFNGGIYHIKDLVTSTRDTLLELSLINQQSLSEIHDVLLQINLHLDMRIKWHPELKNLKPPKRIPTFEEIEFFLQPIEALNFSSRINNILTRSGVRNIGDLVTKTEQTIKSVPNLGLRTFTKIQNELIQRDLHLGLLIEWPLSPEKLNILTKPFTPNEIEFFSQSIEALNFSTRINNILTRSGVRNIGDLVTKTEKDLRRIVSHFGKKSLTEIKEALSEKNLYLGMRIEWPPVSNTNKNTLSLSPLQRQTLINNRGHRTLDNKEKPPTKIYYYGKVRTQ